jgi:hypothetical protein
MWEVLDRIRLKGDRGVPRKVPMWMLQTQCRGTKGRIPKLRGRGKPRVHIPTETSLAPQRRSRHPNGPEGEIAPPQSTTKVCHDNLLQGGSLTYPLSLLWPSWNDEKGPSSDGDGK